ncbi:MAG: hypothetical protein F6K35_49655 [Okeania sp. SIO2H7]|nr:hypothetical protein [Okeania sp. SIO2H7]
MIRAIMILLASVFLLASPVRAADSDLSGIWLGTWTSLNATTYNGSVQMRIEQKGNYVFGDSIVGNTKCSPGRFFEGQLSGKYDNFIEFEVTSAETRNPVAKNWGAITRDRNAISAIYSFDNPDSECFGDVGTMFISKVQPYSQIQNFR